MKYHFHCREEMNNMFKVKSRRGIIYTVYAVEGKLFLVYGTTWKWRSMYDFHPIEEER